MTKKNNPKLGAEDEWGGEFPVSFQPPRGGTFLIELLEPITSPSQFSSAIQVLNAATEDHEVVIDIQCAGGSLYAADRFIHAMRGCRAPIHGIATGGVHSAGTLILLECHSFELSQGFNALIHCGSLGSYGNYNEYVKHVEFESKHMRKYLESAYRGFLTDAELKLLFEGVDIWVDAAGWVQRHNNRNNIMKKKLDALMKKPRKPRVKKDTEE